MVLPDQLESIARVQIRSGSTEMARRALRLIAGNGISFGLVDDSVNEEVEITVTGEVTQAELDAHLNDTTDAHDASAISFSATGTIAATDAQAAIAEVSGDVTALGTWQDYTPVLTATTTSPTLGTGALQTGRYVQIGKLVTGWARIRFGTSGTAAGTGVYMLSLPSTPRDHVSASGSGGPFVGTGIATDNSTSTRQPLIGSFTDVVGSESSIFLHQTSAASTRVAATVPWTWAAEDQLQIQFTYEAA